MFLQFHAISPEDIPRALQIEQDGFPEDEAASLESFQFRQSKAPTLFLGAYSQEDNQLIAYICSTLSTDETITHASMSTHIPEGRSVCIHSVCVDRAHQRRGIALSLLKEYIFKLQSSALYDCALLIAHEELIPLYKKAGFTLVGKSSVTHGPRPWFEMRLDLKEDSQSQRQQQLPAGIWEALQSSSSSQTAQRTDDLVDPSGSNVTDILCTRCNSVILLQGVASLEERPSVQIDTRSDSSHPLLPALPTSPELTKWWLITPSPMKFENIGFSKPVAGILSPAGKPVKLLACAECDLGPLGWSEEDGKEFWLVPARVVYRV
ncbi:acyl-CoA N-acyltransferase [Dendrothele bispora CBS 962.96]|uniref:Acyl-CoA N-acyltransferase n=1 Tax=Dendrothele bispora (strain CBS 962.96) TaxID=1314807 RepID=A0A4S8LM64_DENBC|nr:acyl-CoA N-acyltransferase [Dendrothele bispora CBS 962.96]